MQETDSTINIYILLYIYDTYTDGSFDQRLTHELHTNKFCSHLKWVKKMLQS